MKPVTATWTVCSVELTCLYCQEIIVAPNGSLFWTVVELSVKREAKMNLVCDCGKEVKIPSRIPGL